MSENEDEIIYWEDALAAVLSHRPQSIPPCQYCFKGTIVVKQRGGDGSVRVTRLECPNCGKFIEGRFSAENLADDFVSEATTSPARGKDPK